MIVKGDKIELVKEIRVFKKIGTKFEVDYVDKDGNITFHFRSCDSEIGRPGRATMTYKEFERYFKIVPERVWSEWAPTEVKYYNFSGQHLCAILAQYRTNGKKVQVRLPKTYFPPAKSMRAEAACAPSDDFNLERGLCIAKARLVKKLSDYSYEKLEERWQK